jgi:hypothetical protein
VSAQELIRKTKYEAQVPYTLIGEIAEAIKASESKCPVFPTPAYMQVERIWLAVDLLESAANEASYPENYEGDDPVDIRPYALAVIAEVVRLIKSIPPTPHTGNTKQIASSESQWQHFRKVP